MEMGSQHLGHNHPMVFNEVLSNQIKEASCLRCGEMVSESSFSCMECGLHLHKKCAEAPPEIDHPFHQSHPLVLLPKPPREGRCICSLCSKTCEKFIYHCSCNLDLHIKCALFSLNIAEKKLGELEHLATKVPSVSTEDDSKELEGAKCFVCWEPLLESMHFSLDSGFNLHKKCIELPLEIKHPIHKRHPLILQFNVEHFSCKICHQKPSAHGFSYSCTPCKFALDVTCAELPPTLNLPCHRQHPLDLRFHRKKFSCKICGETLHNKPAYCCSSCELALHSKCVSPPLTITNKNHEHPFTLFWTQGSFICDACGLERHFVSYVCSTCNLSVHDFCLSLPPIIRIPRHKHPIFHKFFLRSQEFKNCECRICYEEVKIVYGSYSCSNCKFIVHVQCALEKKGWFKVVKAKDVDGRLEGDSSMVPKMSSHPLICIERNEDGEMTKIKHFSHGHDLILKNNPTEQYCEGCVLPISDPFYNCSQCDFLLHKACAKLPKKKLLWFHICQRFLILVVGHIFRCGLCQSESNGFSYRCNNCDIHYCLHCATRGYSIKHPAHKHPLFYDRNHEGRCNACKAKRRGLFKCKRCTFNLHIKCLRLQLTVRHSCDRHLLALTFKEDNEYAEYLYCDICEKRRDSSSWFYHCATCDVSAHPGCALGRYPLIKQGSIYEELEDHLHPLTFVKKTFSAPGCHKCGKPCQDLALECADSACSYTVHWDCAKPAYLGSRKPARYKTETDEVVPDSETDSDSDQDTGASCIIL